MTEPLVADHGSLGTMRLADALLWRFSMGSPKGPKTDTALSASGLTFAHLTAGDYHAGDFEALCDSIAETWRLLDEDPASPLVVTTPELLRDHPARSRVGIILGLQGVGPVGAQPERVELLWRLGIRIMQLTYNEANLLGDGCLERRDGGITAAGRRVVEEANRSGILLDVSHAAPNTAADVVALSRQPVIASHANSRDRVASPRNLPDSVLMAVAQSGGAVGVPAWGPTLWRGEDDVRPSLARLAEELEAMIDLIGEDAVMVGTDFPLYAAPLNDEGRGVVNAMVRKHPAAFSRYVAAFGDTLRAQYCEGFNTVASWRDLPEFLLNRNWPKERVRKVVGGNFIRVCRVAWSHRERRLA